MLDTYNSTMLNEAKKAKHKPHIILQILIFILVFLIANIATGLIVGIPVGIVMLQKLDLNSLDMQSAIASISVMLNSLPDWFGAVSLLATVITTLFAILYCIYIEQRSLASMGLIKKGMLKNYGLGYLIGIAMISVTVGLSVLFGGAIFTGKNVGVSAVYIILFFLGFLVQGMSEEVLVRGYFMVSCANKVHVAVAVIISSAVFASLHLLNPGITAIAFINLMLFGIFAAVYILRTDDIWGACAIHSSWNFFQGNVFGISVSGGSMGDSIYGTAFLKGRDLITGGSFGIEGGICTTLVMTVGILLVLYLPQKARATIPQEASNETNNRQLPLYIDKK